MADEPIIVSGGSVTIDMSDKFKDNGPAAGRKKYKNPNGKLLSLEVNGVKVQDLKETDVVRIICDDGAGTAP
jgi:hypothetical protein